MPLNANVYKIIGWIGVALMLAAVIVLASETNWIGMLLSIVFLVASAAFMLFEEPLPSLFDMLFVLAALINGAGWIWEFYKQVPVYDEVAHAYTMFSVTLSFGFLIYHSVRVQLRDRGVLYVLIIATFGLSIGALWEIFEWTFIEDLADPVVDLMMDTLGALAAGVLAASVLRRKPDTFQDGSRGGRNRTGQPR